MGKLTTNPQKSTVIIVGAGIAGLAAANALKKEGFRTVVLEARDRVGGRIVTNNTLGHPIDLGAAWVHGIEGNPVADLMRRYKIQMALTDFANILPYGNDKQNFSQKMEIIENLLNEFSSQLKTDLPLSLALKEVLQANPGKINQEDILSFDSHFLTSYTGADAQDISTRYWNEEEILPGGNYLVLDGYGSIIHELARDIEIHLNNKVELIAYHGDKINVVTNQGNYLGDAVIVTIPLGVLQSNLIDFDPPLPVPKARAIKSLGMGVHDRIILKFPQVFWPSEYHGFSLFGSPQSPISLFINYYHFIKMPILAGLLGGYKARQLEASTDEEVIDLAMNELRKMFGKKVILPEAYLITRWSQDPYSLGSYSYVKIGAHGHDYDVMSEPINGKIFFAGEATHRKYPASVHGAYLSGIREAKRITR